MARLLKIKVDETDKEYDIGPQVFQGPGINKEGTMSQNAITDFVASHGTGWSAAQIALLETILSHLAYDDATAGQTAADSLIASLRSTLNNGAGIAKYTVTVQADTQCTVTIVDGDGNTINSGEQVDEGTTLTVTITLNTAGYVLSSAIVNGVNYTEPMTFAVDGNVSVVARAISSGGSTPALDHLTAVFRDATTTSVPAGTTLDGLASMIVVKAIYDDDTTFDTLAYGSTYTMSGTLTAGQSNAIEVSGLGAYSSLTPITFSVTVDAATLTEITANYTGGTVPEGTTLDGLKDKTIVVAHYSDGTTEVVTDYTLSGTLTAGQTNTITATYHGKTATFDVTVGESNITISVADGKITTNATGLTVSDGNIILN